MKKLQSSTAAKVCAWIVLLCAALGAGVFGVRALLSFQSVTTDTWQSGSRFYNARENRYRELIDGVYLTQRLELLEKKVEEGTADAVTYADIEALKENRAGVEEHFSRDNTWFRFCLTDADTGKTVGTNLAEGESMLKAVKDIFRSTIELSEESWLEYGYYDPSAYGYEIAPGDQADQKADAEADPAPLRLVLEYGVPENIETSSIDDEFYRIWVTWMNERVSFDQHLTGFLNLGALSLLSLFWVLWSAGHKKGRSEIVTTWQERIWFDLYAAAMIAAVVALAVCTVEVAQQLYWSSTSLYAVQSESYDSFFKLGVMGAGALFAAGAGCAALLLRTFTVRLKARCLGKTTLLCRVVTWMVRTIHDFIRFLPLTWKVVLGFLIYTMFSFWLLTQLWYDGGWILAWFLVQIALLLFLSWWAYGYYRLRQGTKTIVGGDLEYQIDTRRMPYDLRLQAEDLNNISAGLSAAVDEKMKSERFKAELITNVSHDLKTPLTSIINYVDLLKTTEQTDPKAQEYIEVLDRKSQRLKKLTEDLVEASKASTGVLSVTREKIGMGQLIDQALGEWEEKLNDRKLTLVTTLPEGETWVYADGRHLWRVIDNLLSNCSKYAMEGTRVYLDLERGKGQVTLSVKNISREPLNVPAERLMERFVRGEESRSTEGSGLGLSIARSLTELQGGTFELAVDGDLFKAIVTLPQAN